MSQGLGPSLQHGPAPTTPELTQMAMHALAADLGSHVPEFQNQALDSLSDAVQQEGFQLERWPQLITALLKVMLRGLGTARHEPDLLHYDMFPCPLAGPAAVQDMSAALRAGALLRSAMVSGEPACQAAVLEAGLLPVLTATLRAVREVSSSAWPGGGLGDARERCVAGMGACALRLLAQLAPVLSMQLPALVPLLTPLLAPGIVCDGGLLAVLTAQAIAAMLAVAGPTSVRLGAGVHAACWTEPDLLSSLQQLMTLPYADIRMLAQDHLNAQLDSEELLDEPEHRAQNGKDASSTQQAGNGKEESMAQAGGNDVLANDDAVAARRAAAIATAPDYIAMAHQAQAVSAALTVLRRLVEGGNATARRRVADSPLLLEGVVAVLLTRRPGYPLSWQAAVQTVPACRAVLDGHMTPVMCVRSLSVRQARFDAGVVLALLGLDPATRPAVQPMADVLALGVAAGKVAVSQPVAALLAVLHPADEASRRRGSQEAAGTSCATGALPGSQASNGGGPAPQLVGSLP